MANWFKQDKINRGESERLSGDKRAELAQLRTENAKLRLERDDTPMTLLYGVKGLRAWFVCRAVVLLHGAEELACDDPFEGVFDLSEGLASASRRVM